MTSEKWVSVFLGVTGYTLLFAALGWRVGCVILGAHLLWASVN